MARTLDPPSDESSPSQSSGVQLEAEFDEIRAQFRALAGAVLPLRRS